MVIERRTPTHHALHGEPAVELWPAEHESQRILPLSADWRPAGHATQASPPELAPTPSAVNRLRVTYEPAKHWSHSAAPSAPLNVPVGHSRHCVADTAPGSLRYFPIGQLVHTPMSHEWQLSTGSHVPCMPAGQPDWQSELTPKSNMVPDARDVPLGAEMCESKKRSWAIELKAAWP